MTRALALFTLSMLSTTAYAEDVAAGKLIYAQHCVVCHGLKGKGDGPSGKALNPKPSDFATSKADEAAWFKETKLGSKAVGKPAGMDGFAGKLTDAQIHEVLAYVKTLKQP